MQGNDACAHKAGGQDNGCSRRLYDGGDNKP